MNTTKKTQYPNILQSFGITGIALLMTILALPIVIIREELGSDLFTLLSYVIPMTAAFSLVHYLRKRKTGYKSYNLKSSSVLVFILLILATISLQFGIISPIATSIPMPESLKQAMAELMMNKGVFSFIAIVICAPILEELIFRGIILDGLLKKYTPLKSILISSLLFGIVHMNPVQLVAGLIIGSLIGWVYYKTKNLTLAIFIHFVNNFAAYSSSYFMDTETMLNGNIVEFYGGVTNLILIITIAITVLTASVIFLNNQFKKIGKTNDSKFILA